MKFTRIVMAAGALAMLASGALATTFNVAQQGDNVFGGGGGNATVNYSLTSPDPDKIGSAQVGGFRLKASPLGDFVAWCLTLTRTLTLASDYKFTSTPFDNDPLVTLGDTKKLQMRNLFDNVYDTTSMSLTDNTQSAAFQVALWELIYDDSPFNTSSGVFGITQTDISMLANTYLTMLDAPTERRFNLVFLESLPDASGVRSQNLVTVSAVPLPAGVLLLVSGFAAAGVVSHRRRRRAAAA